MILLVLGVVVGQSTWNKWDNYVSSYHGAISSGSDEGGWGLATFSFGQGNYPVFDTLGNMFVAERHGGRVRKIAADGTTSTVVTGLNNPVGLAIDDLNQLWICDFLNHKIKLYSGGVVSVVAGSTAGDGDGIGTAAFFNGPTGIVLDGRGSAYITEWYGDRVRKMNLSTYSVTTFAGSPTSAYGSTDAVGTSARFNSIYAITIDSNQNLYVADTENFKIRKITPNAVVTTLAGSSAGYQDGPGATAKFGANGLASITIDKDNNLYVADRVNHAIRMINQTGYVTTIAGGFSGTTTTVDGVLGFAKIFYPNGATIHPDGSLYFISSTPNTIGRIAPRSIPMAMNSLAQTYTSPGLMDGPLTTAQFNFSTGSLCRFGPLGELVIADRGNGRVRVLYNGTVVTVATELGDLYGVEVDKNGNIYVSEQTNNRILLITRNGTVTTIAGSSSGYQDSTTGQSAKFNAIRGLKLDNAGEYLYVADGGNNCIRRIRLVTNFPVTTFAGTCTSLGYVNGASAKFKTPTSIAFDSKGNMYVVDSTNFAIRIVNSAGQTSTYAGRAPNTMSVGQAGFRDGIGLMALFSTPTDIVIDRYDTLYISDTGNHRIRMITSDGFVTTIAGNGTAGNSTGYGSASNLNSPFGLAVSTSGDLYSTQAGDSVIRKITVSKQLPQTDVTLFAGTTAGFQDGPIATAKFNFWDSQSMAVDAIGNIYVPDDVNSKIRKITPSGNVTTFSSSCTNPRDVAIELRTNTLWATCHDLNRVHIYNLNGNLVSTIGSGNVGNSLGSYTTASFSSSYGIIFDSKGYAYVSGFLNANIRKIDPFLSQVSAFVGTSNNVIDGDQSTAALDRPLTLAIDSKDNLYTADMYNHIIRKITPEGRVTTIAGQVGISGSDDGPGRSAKFWRPCGLAVDEFDNIYVAERGNNRIRMITPDNEVFTLAGSTGSSINAMGPLANFSRPHGLKYYNQALYVLNNQDYRIIQKISLTYKPCALGSYFDGGLCRKCPIGTYLSTSGTANSCIKCPMGSFSLEGATSCTPCSASGDGCIGNQCLCYPPISTPVNSNPVTTSTSAITMWNGTQLVPVCAAMGSTWFGYPCSSYNTFTNYNVVSGCEPASVTINCSPSSITRAILYYGVWNSTCGSNVPTKGRMYTINDAIGRTSYSMGWKHTHLNVQDDPYHGINKQFNLYYACA